jgi:hypothetical protein
MIYACWKISKVDIGRRFAHGFQTEQQDSRGNWQKSYRITKMPIFATLDKANPDTGNLRGLNLAALKHTTVQVIKLPL